MTKGTFIVLYGVNNTGKTTQAQLLVAKLQQQGIPAQYIKYHLYQLEPYGSLINGYIRGGNPHQFSSREFQLLGVANKLQFQTELQALLENGITIVAEDYKGTSVAWGMGGGMDKALALSINSALYKEDVALLLDGQRFIASREQQHIHEKDDVLTERARQHHLELARDFGWQIINANQSIDAVHAAIWSQVETFVIKKRT